MESANQGAQVPAMDWQHQIDAGAAGQVLAAAIRQGHTHDRDALLFHDLDQLSARIAELRAAFPASTLHALAIKSNPLVSLLRFAVERGMGLEAASLEEVALARAAGCPAARIVFDSPAKTRREIAQSLAWGITLNADNFDEIERIGAAVAAAAGRCDSMVGLRVNPQVGDGSIGMTSVAGAYSKFGVPLEQRREAIIDAYRHYPWLRGLHLHVGSQGVTEQQLAAAVEKVFELRSQIHAALGEARIHCVDIGGGLSWRYREDSTVPTPRSYAAVLRARVPLAFAPEVQLITEYGRCVQTGCGFAASRVEYVKTDGGRRTAVIHFGADLMMRRVYRPDDWYYRFSVLAPDGSPKQGAPVAHTIAGPLCFGGDLLARDLPLPQIEEGDWVIIHDTGGYTLSMWSRHCNRGLPTVLGYAGNPPEFSCLHAGESPEDVVRFWNV